MKISMSSADAWKEAEKISALTRISRSISVETQWRLFSILLVLSDSLLTAFAFRLAYDIRFGLDIPFFRLEVIPEVSFYEQLVTLMIPGWVILFLINGLYNRQNLLGGTQEYSKIFSTISAGMMVVVLVSFLVPQFILARGWLVLAWVLSFSMVAVGRFVLRRFVYTLRARGFFLSPALIIGANSESLSLAEQLMRWTTSGLHVVGFIQNSRSPQAVAVPADKVLGNLDELDELVAKHHIDELILTSSAVSRQDILEIFQRYGVSDKVNLRLSSGLYEIITTGLQVKEFAYVPLVGINKVRLTGWDSVFKALMDYALVIAGLLVALPIYGLIALAIKLDSPGPAIYRRRVMGVNGKQFDAFKFRTMHVNGDAILEQYPELKEELARTHKLKVDPRITRVGNLLRKTSLDELPQVFNVLRGEMSLVGPRMISPPEMELYQQQGINLLTVKPGITGLWQVSGRSDVSYPERVRLDMYYIRNWSIWMDLQLLFQTIPAVLKRRGAY